MQTEQTSPQDSLNQALADLTRLRQFTGTPGEFWNAFLSCATNVAGASQCVLAVKKTGSQDWQKMGQWPATPPGNRFAPLFAKHLLEIADQCVQAGTLALCLDSAVPSNAKPYAVAIRLPIPQTDDLCIIALLVAATTEIQAREIIVRLQLVADTPVTFQANQMAQQTKADIDKFASALDLMVLVNAEKRFLASGMAFCNAIAAKFNCDRVSLGWLEKGFIKLQAISRTEKFDRNMAVVKALEIAMEEALDQDEEIVLPAPQGATQITRDHAAFARDQGIQYMCSLPLRLDGSVVGVLTCERQSATISESDLKQLRLCCDQATRRLSDLKGSDRWFGARMAANLRERLSKWLGPDRTLSKALVVIASVAILLLLVLRINYRVEGKFILHTDELAYISAPFEGFIASVPVRVSDPVKSQQVVLSLDKKDLELEEASALADLARYARESEKARAVHQLADMRIAQALADQSKAKLELVRYRLNQASLRTPFEGVVVEGEQRERVGAPVKQGEVLFRVARLDNLYVETEVNERDIHEIKLNATGEIAFASQPKLKFPIKVVRILPAAQAKEAVNVFLVRCAVTGKPDNWWRPGMTGLTKINTGKRSLLWVLTHRTVDYLRMLLWW